MNKFKLLSFWTIDFDAVFDIKFVNLIAFTKLYDICESKDKNQIEIVEFKKLHFSNWLNPQLKMFVLRKGTGQIGKKCVDSLSKRLIYISFIEIHIQIGLFLEISEAVERIYS